MLDEVFHAPGLSHPATSLSDRARVPNRGVHRSSPLPQRPRGPPIAGYGVFLDDDAVEGARIEECLTLRTELDGVGTSDYVFEVRDDDDELVPLLPLGYGALYNHSGTPNIEWEYDPDTDLLSFFALRPIIAGEELLFDYGALYWETRPGLRAR